MTFTYYGQSCFLLETNGIKILFDPFILQNPLATGVDTKRIAADYIFVSHGHSDHVADLAVMAKQTNAHVYAMVEVASWASKQGIKKVEGLNFGIQHFPFGQVRTVHALHSSSNPDGSYGGNPAGFVFNLDGKQIYFAGDTALTYDMKILAELHTLDYAILPIGGWYTMDVSDALVASNWVNCNKVIGVHYNTFPPITIDTGQAVKQFEQAGKSLLLPEIGQTIEL